jgi:hypothetical protein
VANVAVTEGALQIELTVPERVFSLHGASVVVPLETIRGVRVVRDVLGQLRGLRTPGAGIPGVAAIGVWRGIADGRRFHDFVLVRRPGPGLVITTTGEYSRVLLGTEDTDDYEKLAAELGFPT